MKESKSSKVSSGLFLIFLFVVVSLIRTTPNNENTKGSLFEQINEIHWHEGHPAVGSIKFVSPTIQWWYQAETDGTCITLISDPWSFSSLGYLGKYISFISATGKSLKIESELLPLHENHNAAIERLNMNYNLKMMRHKRQTKNETVTDPNSTTNVSITTSASPTSSTSPTSSASDAPDISHESEGNGWPTWVWIVIGIAVLLVVIAVIISIIVCINMNNKPDEISPSAPESMESLSGSESELSQEEGERRLQRSRRRIAACSYCPQTLQRPESDGLPCGRNCCNTELIENRNVLIRS